MTKDSFSQNIQNLKKAIASLDPQQQEEFILDKLKSGPKVTEIFGNLNSPKQQKKKDVSLVFEEYIAALKGLHSTIMASPEMSKEQKKQSKVLSSMVDQLAEQMRDVLKNK